MSTQTWISVMRPIALEDQAVPWLCMDVYILRLNHHDW